MISTRTIIILFFAINSSLLDAMPMNSLLKTATECIGRFCTAAATKPQPASRFEDIDVSEWLSEMKKDRTAACDKFVSLWSENRLVKLKMQSGLPKVFESQKRLYEKYLKGEYHEILAKHAKELHKSVSPTTDFSHLKKIIGTEGINANLHPKAPRLSISFSKAESQGYSLNTDIEELSEIDTYAKKVEELQNAVKKCFKTYPAETSHSFHYMFGTKQSKKATNSHSLEAHYDNDIFTIVSLPPGDENLSYAKDVKKESESLTDNDFITVRVPNDDNQYAVLFGGHGAQWKLNKELRPLLHKVRPITQEGILRLSFVTTSDLQLTT